MSDNVASHVQDRRMNEYCCSSTHRTTTAESTAHRDMLLWTLSVWPSRDKLRFYQDVVSAIPNPGKHWYLEAVAQVLKRANAHRTKDGLHPAKKALIEVGLDVPDDNVWRISMLHSKLREIVDKNREYFEGKDPEEDSPTSDSESHSDCDMEMTSGESQSEEPSLDANIRSLFSSQVQGFSGKVSFASLLESADETIDLADAKNGLRHDPNLGVDNHSFGDDIFQSQQRLR